MAETSKPCRGYAGRKREDLFDIAKGLGIIFVIAGHIYFDYFDTPFFQAICAAIFSFHMPLFFLISGYFLYDQTGRKNVVRRRARQLLLPYCVTGIGMVLLSFIYDIMRGRTFDMVIGAIKAGNMELFNETALAWLGGILHGSAQDYETPFYIKGIGAIYMVFACPADSEYPCFKAG